MGNNTKPRISKKLCKDKPLLCPHGNEEVCETELDSQTNQLGGGSSKGTKVPVQRNNSCLKRKTTATASSSREADPHDLVDVEESQGVKDDSGQTPAKRKCPASGLESGDKAVTTSKEVSGIPDPANNNQSLNQEQPSTSENANEEEEEEEEESRRVTPNFDITTTSTEILENISRTTEKCPRKAKPTSRKNKIKEYFEKVTSKRNKNTKPSTEDSPPA
uniref:Shugoshin_C domain-containing protein n=1 Tax=Strongyloides stercoralis TaxID=6248 RepID=A0A0K0E845_STRER